MFFTYKFRYRTGGKHVFVPNEAARRKGKKLLRFIDAEVQFPDNFYHYRRGGHVAALHRHLDNAYFFRVDLQSFFYSIARHRVAEALRRIGFARSRSYAKWSCVPNPIATGPRYSLPIGFVQSPALASLVLMRTPVMAEIQRAADAGVYISVYLDDLIGSARDVAALRTTYDAILAACAAANLIPNPAKLIAPAERIQAFNCNLTHGMVEVREERIAKFFSIDRTDASETAFLAYCKTVEAENHPPVDDRGLRKAPPRSDANSRIG